MSSNVTAFRLCETKNQWIILESSFSFLRISWHEVTTIPPDDGNSIPTVFWVAHPAGSVSSLPKIDCLLIHSQIFGRLTVITNQLVTFAVES